ncbi:hypothetical protein [Streptomyces longisporoflavus]|uniref:DUF2357 domain-containing protein n=1 Tax=Streptomyces longisporoflavus TaxID=28044 RepID=A0ABW7QXR6_9ACTN
MDSDDLLDRVSGRPVSGTVGRALTGQYILLPERGSAEAGRRPLGTGEYYVDKRGRSDRAESDQVTVEAVLAIGRIVATLTARQASLAELADIHPLVDGAAAMKALSRQPLEEAIEEHLPFLRSVCFRPVSRLRPINRLVPVPRARRITPQTVMRLAAHSEDWASLRPDGVRPDRVLSPEREVNLDLYENRVAVHLVDQLWRYLTARMAQIRDIKGMFSDVERYIDDVSSRPWQQSSLRLWHLLAQFVEQEEWDARASLRLQELEKLRSAVSALRRSPLWNGVNRRAELGTSLRATNLLIGEDRFRHVAELWQQWMATRTRFISDDGEFSRGQDWCRGYECYVAVLLLRAFDEVGGQPADQSVLARGAVPVNYRYRGSDVTLRWGEDGVLVIERDETVVLRVVPLPHPLTDSRLRAPVLDELAMLNVQPPIEPTLVLYPGGREERQELPQSVRLQAFEAPGAPAPGKDGTPLWKIPISPLEIDSVTRLGRGLRFVLEQPRLSGYPYQVLIGTGVDTDFVSRIPWLSMGTNGLIVTRVPADHEIAAARAMVLAQRRDTSRFQQRGTNSTAVEALWEEVGRAVKQTVALTRCPRCGAESASPDRALQIRGDGQFRCSCGQCGGIWEGRRCRTCLRLYPILESSALVDAGSTDGDYLDRHFATDLLAAPCWVRARVFICPRCAVCGNAEGESQCARCSDGSATAGQERGGRQSRTSD